jgi:hypothetical protein
MTISSSYSYNLTRDQIIEEALDLSGILGDGQLPTPTMYARGTRTLNIGLKSLQNDGIIITTVERTTATLTAGTGVYTTAADTLDVLGEAFIRNTPSGADTMVRKMSRAEYQALTSKSAQGRPVAMYIERGMAAVTINLWPLPDSDSNVLGYSRMRFLRDMDSGGATPDLPSRWLKTLVFMVAHGLALKYGRDMTECREFERQFQEAKAMALGEASEHGDIQFVVGAY